MSKSSKGCQYEFQQGEKKGEKCGINCRGNLCFKHNKKTLAYQKNYYDKTTKKIVPESEPIVVQVNVQVNVPEKVGCKYEFLQGTKKGKKCDVPCRGDFCHNHKAGIKEKKHEYYENKSADSETDKIMKMTENELYTLRNPALLKKKKIWQDIVALKKSLDKQNIILECNNKAQVKQAENEIAEIKNNYKKIKPKYDKQVEICKLIDECIKK